MVSEITSMVHTDAVQIGIVIVCVLLVLAVIVVISTIAVGTMDDGDATKWTRNGSIVAVVALSALFVVLNFAPMSKTEGVAFSDAKEFVKQQTGNDLTSSAIFPSASPSDPQAEDLKSLESGSWYVLTSDYEVWDLKAHENGQLGFRNRHTKKWVSLDAMTAVKLPYIKKQIEQDSELTDVTTKFTGGGNLVRYQLSSPSGKLLLATGEYKGQLVEAYVGMDEGGDIRLVPVNKAGGVTEDDLIKK